MICSSVYPFLAIYSPFYEIITGIVLGGQASITAKYRIQNDEPFAAFDLHYKAKIETEKITRGIKHVDAEVIKSYARDLKRLLEEADIAESKVFLRHS